MEKFPGTYGGTTTSVTESEKTTQVAVAKGKIKEDSEFKSILKEFISDDVKDIRKNLITRVIIPSTQKLIIDVVNNSVNWFFYGIKGSTNNRPNVPYQMVSNTSRIYNTYQTPTSIGQASNRGASNVFNFVNYGYDTRGDAELVLASLQDNIYQKKPARLSNYKILSGHPVTNVDEDWGWRNLDGVRVELQADGLYYIQFPGIEDLRNTK